MKRLDLLNELSDIQSLLDASVCEYPENKYVQKARGILQFLREKLEELDI